MTSHGKVRVLIVDDSAFMRKVLHSILLAEPGFDVVGEARDGREAAAQAEALKPDVITMDINMPHVDGLQATEQIMSTNPRPILIVSSESREGAEITLKALELGAIDFVAKPNSGVDLDMSSVRDELVRKLRVAAKVRVVRTASRTKLGQEIASSAPRTEPGIASKPQSNLNGAPVGRSNSKFPLVVIAASTGGPATLMKLMPAFPREFPGAVILVQHMPGNFTAQFSEQLSQSCAIRVKEA
ncbi:MAG: response regulator, partial [Acidobacteria bacterium]|nr:response regulator [Acidobacteriota bacterium]